MKHVAIVYHNWPHYRTAVGRSLDESARYNYTFYGDLRGIEGIKVADPQSFESFVDAPYRFYWKMMWQPRAMRPAIDRTADVVIYHCDPKFVMSWIGSVVARLRGKRVLFWGHGWLRPERFWQRTVRNIYYRLAHHVLVYSERGKRLGVDAGFRGDRITTIYNSLDVGKAKAVRETIEADSGGIQPADFFADADRPLIVCTARLTAVCRFDLLLDAAALLAKRNRPINILLVGDGSERAALEALASRLDVDVHFFGPCYDEEVIGRLIARSDLTVSPGKIGLTAMHSMMYGTPAITHGDFDNQMPEFEAIEPGVSGAFFRRGDAADLADTIVTWLDTHPDREAVRMACYAVIDAKWTPEVQVRLIEEAIDGTFHRHSAKLG